VDDVVGGGDEAAATAVAVACAARAEPTGELEVEVRDAGMAGSCLLEQAKEGSGYSADAPELLEVTATESGDGVNEECATEPKDPWLAIREELTGVHESIKHLDSRSRMVEEGATQPAAIKGGGATVTEWEGQAGVQPPVPLRYVQSQARPPPPRPRSSLLGNQAESTLDNLHRLGETAGRELAQLDGERKVLDRDFSLIRTPRNVQLHARELTAAAAEARAQHRADAGERNTTSLKEERQRLRQQDAARQQGAASFADLPADALLAVFGNLGARDLLRGTALVCKAWHIVSLDLGLYGRASAEFAGYPAVDLRKHVSAGDADGHRAEVLRLRMQRRVQRIPELSLLLQK